MRITRYAVNRHLAISTILIALTVLGLYGLQRLPVDYLPGITYPMVKVNIWWRGATPEEIEKNIAEVIEGEVATVDRLDLLESSAIEGMYSLTVSFEYGADVDVAYQDVLAAMARARRRLPEDIEEPVVFKADPSQLPVMQLAVSSEQWDLVQLRDWSERWLKDELIAVQGVAGTNIAGGYKREIRVLLDADSLEKHGIALDSILKRLAEENIDQFGGRITTGRREIIARTVGEYESLDDIRSIVVARNGQAFVRLGDLARVEDGHEEERTVTRLDGQPSINLYILKQADANTVQVADAVGRKLDEMQAALPADIRISVIDNQAVYVRSAINGVRNAALQAVVLLILIVYLFLGSFRQVLVMMLALPLTIIFNFGLMSLAGLSLNIFSLGGLVVVLGVVLDNAIIVMESITRHRHDKPGASAADHAIEGSSVVGPAIIAATFSFVALFMPFLMVESLISMLFRELILVMAGIVAISLTLAITLVPMLTAVLFGRSPRTKKSRFIMVFDIFANGYERFLGGVLRMRWLVLAGFALLFAMGIALLGRVGGEFLPPIDDGRIMVKVKMPTGTALAETDRVLRRVEALIADDPLIKSRFVLAGGQVRALNTYEISNQGQMDIQLVPRDQRDVSTGDYVARLRPMLAKAGVPGARIMASQKRLRGIKGLSQADIQIKLRGQEAETLFGLAQRTTEAMRGLEYFANVYVSLDMSKPEYKVRVDRVKAAEFGITVADVASALRSLITGAVPTRYLDDGEYYDIRVLVPEKEIVSRQDLENLPLVALNGGFLRLRDVARVEQSVGPVEIARENQVKQVTVQADVVGVSVAQAREQLTAVLSDLDRPVGYDYSYGGQAELMADMRKSVIAVIGFAVFFAFIVLSVQFNSWKLPGLVLGSVPLSLAGAVFALTLTGLSFGATVIIGMLVVIAATVNDGVLLFTLANEIQEAEGKTPAQSIRDSARIRLRTRLMTTMTTMAGFLPLALNLEEGGDMLQPMAVAAIGGLALEMLVALFFMPCLYVLFTKHKKPGIST
jgi:hydrophobic/amphiphilic exporter-1 (mainly G- bacteria), HAE1 family